MDELFTLISADSQRQTPLINTPEYNFNLLGFVKIPTILCLSNISLSHLVLSDEGMHYI